MKARTIFTSLAISLGIVSMFVVCNLYFNFNSEISDLEKRTVSLFPISISTGEYEMDNDNYALGDKDIKVKNKDSFINVINNDYINYINNIAEIKYITYGYDIFLPMISDSYKLIDNGYLMAMPSKQYIIDNYDIIYGNNVSNKYDILLKLDSNNAIDDRFLNYFNIEGSINYNDIVGRKIRVGLNNQYYNKKNGYYVINNSLADIYQNSYIELNISGIIKEKDVINENNYLYYDFELLNEILDINSKSNIVLDQLNSDYNVLGMGINKDELLSYLGYNSLPNNINIYVDSLGNKNIVINKLDKYNNEHDKVLYIDTMSMTVDLLKNFINIISVVLIAFSLIAIIISSLMISILTNIRVVERKKEIGIIRSLGASRRDIKKIFNTENLFIGSLSMIISFFVCHLLINPINNVIYNALGIENIFKINYLIMILVFIFIFLIIKISSINPIRRASKLDIIDCITGR